MKYTKEILSDVVKENISVAGVLRSLNLKPSGGNHSHISSRIRYFEIDTSHFLGSRANSGERHVGGPEKLTADQLLVYNRLGRREHANKLRRALREINRYQECEICGIGQTWQGKKLVLEINHINRDFLDNRRENLQVICPNCHSQQ